MYSGKEIYLATHSVTFNDDIGLIKIWGRIAFDETINKINLWRKKEIDYNLPMETASYGYLNSNYSTKILYKVRLIRGVPFDKCKRRIEKRFPEIAAVLLKDKILCTLSFDVAFHFTDGGCGIIIRNGNYSFLIAVHSSAVPDFDSAQTIPALHTKIYSHIRWITRITGIKV